jgi:tetratricopeptide (TPR) repeat protein
MRSTVGLLVLLVTSSAIAEGLTGQFVTVVRDQTRVVHPDGTFERFIPIGASFVVKAEKGDFVELQPADPEAPVELIESYSVVPAKEAAAFMKARAESENTATAWINLGVFLRRTDLEQHVPSFLKASRIKWLDARLQTEFGRSFELIGNLESALKHYETAADLARFETECLKLNKQWFAHSHTISYPHEAVHSPAPRDYETYMECALGFDNLSTGTNRKERVKAAESHFLNALGRDLNCTAAYCGLSEAYQAQGRRDDAIRAISAILARRPFDHVHLIERAELWEKVGDLRRAREDFDRAVDVAGGCPCALRDRAGYFERQHELRLAMDDLDAAIRLEPENIRILDQRIRLQASLGAYDGALADLQTLRRIEPSARHMRPLEGMLWQLKGDLAKAKVVYREFGPGSRDCCRMCMRQGDFASALEDCNAMVADWQGRIEKARYDQERDAYQLQLISAWRARGYCLEQLGRLDEALVDYTEWSKVRPADRLAHLSLARVLKGLGRDQEAAEATSKVMELGKETCTNYVARGLAREAMGDIQGALDDYVAADRIHGKCGASLGSMAWIHATAADASLRNGPRAVEQAERAIPLNGAPRRRKDTILAAAYAEAGNFEAAIRQIEKCMSSRDSHDKRELMPTLDQYRKGIAKRSEPWEIYLP